MGNKSPSEHVGPIFEKGHSGDHFGILPNFKELWFLKISPISGTVRARAKRTKIWHPWGNKSPSEHVGPLFEKGHPGGHFGISLNFEELQFLKISPISETVRARAKRTNIWHPLGNKSPSEHVGPLFEKGHPDGHFDILPNFEELRFMKISLILDKSPGENIRPLFKIGHFGHLPNFEELPFLKKNLGNVTINKSKHSFLGNYSCSCFVHDFLFFKS